MACSRAFVRLELAPTVQARLAQCALRLGVLICCAGFHWLGRPIAHVAVEVLARSVRVRRVWPAGRAHGA